MEPEISKLTKNLALKVESDQLEELAQGKGTIIKFSDDDDSDDDSINASDYGEDTEDEGGDLNSIRPDRKKRLATNDEQTKQALIKTEIMTLTEDLRRSGIKSLQGQVRSNSARNSNQQVNVADEPELELEPTRFNNIDEDRSINARYSNLGKYSDLLKNGGFIAVVDNMVYKNPIRQGTGPLIDEQSTVIFDCACWTEYSHEPYDSTWLRKKAFVTQLSSESVIPGIREILRTMRKGERCEAIIKPQYAYKELGVPPRIPRNATIFCLIDVLRIYEDSSLARLLISPSGAQQSGISFKTFLAVCNDARMLGNYYLQKGNPWKALERYRSGRIILDSLVYKDEEEEKAANSVLVKLYNNSSNALLQLNKPRTTLTFCKLALELDRHNVKAHWFYVRAWEMLEHFDRALRWAEKGLKLSGDYRTNFIMKIEKVKLDLKRQQKLQSDLMRKMGSCFN